MHESSYLRMQYLVKHYEPILKKGKETVKVLDIGSYDVNGTYRGIFDVSEWQYTGLDMEAGPNVDIVPKDPYHWDIIPDETFDLVISGQAFEHIEYPWVTIKEIERVLKPSGFCILTAPSAGVEHKYPKDCYRYYAGGLSALAKWADLKVCHASVGGYRKQNIWRNGRATGMMHFLWHRKHLMEQKNCRSLLYGRTGLSFMVIRECASYAGRQPLVFIISLKDFSDLRKRTDWEKNETCWTK